MKWKVVFSQKDLSIIKKKFGMIFFSAQCTQDELHYILKLVTLAYVLEWDSIECLLFLFCF